jgi:secreted trypsin-like serine protease
LIIPALIPICPVQGAFNDIAVLILERMPQTTDYIGPACIFLAKRRELHDTGFKGFEVAGWGKTQSGRITDHLQFIAMTRVSKGTCQEAYSKISIQKSQLCAEGDEETRSDACRGDSGGPLVTTVQGHVYLVGIVSFGATSCDSSKPAIFTRVASYYEWLWNVMNSSEPEEPVGKMTCYIIFMFSLIFIVWDWAFSFCSNCNLLWLLVVIGG